MNSRNLINSERLLNNIKELGEIGRNGEGILTRLALSETDKEGRDLVISWMREANLDIKIDKIGNIFGVWKTLENEEKKSSNDRVPYRFSSKCRYI